MVGQKIRQRSNGSNEFELKSVQVTSPTHARPTPNPIPIHYTTPRQKYNSKSQKYYCCVFISIFLIITGIILVVQSDVKRAKQAVIEPYNNQIKKWNQKFKSEFLNVKWRLRISPNKYNYSHERNSSLNSNYSTDQNFNSSSESFLNIPLVRQNFEKQVLEETDFYDQITYNTKNSLFRILFIDNNNKNNIDFKNQSTSDYTKNSNNIEINSQYINEFIAITPQMQQIFEFELQYKINDCDEIWQGINLGEIQIVQRKESKMASWKSCQFREGGRWFKGSCITYKQIDQLCYIVAYHAKTQKYVLDKKYGGVGCAVGRIWLPYHLHRIRVSPRGTEVAKIPVQRINNPFLTIMHAHDPELYARNATHGTLIVAETNLETYAAGMTLLLFGSVLAFPLVILAAMWMVKKSTRPGKYQKYQKFYNSDDDDDDSDDY